MREFPGVERRGIAEQHQRQGHLCQKSDVTDIDVGSNHVEDFVAEQEAEPGEQNRGRECRTAESTGHASERDQRDRYLDDGRTHWSGPACGCLVLNDHLGQLHSVTLTREPRPVERCVTEGFK